MLLKELEIQGFKSFPDKVRITFDRGVTGVVGPNGSGKSNLSDAVRWVLGETSSRQLRSAGKMEDVIFGGARRRGAMGYASVRLTLDNADHALDRDAAEVTIGRRYYRSGESEYTVNGQACRLKDIYELLLDTGIGRDGYSIIGQGRIAEIVAAKGSERREIFEDACGIAKYRYRRTEAEHSLAAAEGNLERLRDILAELEGRVGPLAKEAGMKYMVLTTRHHEGFSLWDSKVNPFNSVNYGPHRDIVREFVEACREYGLKIGFYSTVMEWRHPDSSRCIYESGARRRYQDYLLKLNEELLSNYGKIDILWYDVPEPMESQEGWNSLEMNQRMIM